VDVDDPIVEAFGEAVGVTLREMAGVEAVLCGMADGPVADGPDTLSVLLRLTSGDGYIALCFPGPVAAVIARRVLAETGAEPDAVMVRDCLGEVANVIAGQAKTLLCGTPHHFFFSTPSAVPSPPADGPRGWAARFASDVGEFTLHVQLPS
jgi:CheY-specific phosphatase CheX